MLEHATQVMNLSYVQCVYLGVCVMAVSVLVLSYIWMRRGSST